MTKRGRSLRRVKCPNSPNGKHTPKYKLRDGVVQSERSQVCQYCGKRLRRWKIR